MSTPKILFHRHVLLLTVAALTAAAALALDPGLVRAEIMPAAFPAPQATEQPAPERKHAAQEPAAQPEPQDITPSGTVKLTADFVIMLYTTGDIGTIFLGNSAIADATLTDGRMIVLRGIAQGVTNVIVLDTDGVKMADFVVEVSARNRGTVTVRRAMDMQSYGCLIGLCESTSGAGDPPSLPGPN